MFEAILARKEEMRADKERTNQKLLMQIWWQAMLHESSQRWQRNNYLNQ